MQHVLREQFCVRIFIGALSATGCILYIKFNIYKPSFWGVILGLCGSALVWSFVELIDFIIKTFHQYNLERNDFFKMNYNHWHEILKAINSSDNACIDFYNVKKEIDKFYSSVAEFPFNGAVYSISKEFEEAHNYIHRLHWKFHGFFWNRHDRNLDVNSDEYKCLYEVMVKSEINKVSIKNMVSWYKDIDGKSRSLKNIKINYDKFDIPNGLVEHGCNGNIRDTFNLTGHSHEILTLKPQKDFEDRFLSVKTISMIKTVIGLLFRKIR